MRGAPAVEVNGSGRHLRLGVGGGSGGGSGGGEWGGGGRTIRVRA